MRVYDITPPITPDMAVWPGDTAPRREVLMELADGDPVTLSTLHATVHLGAHVDGPNHYGKGAPAIDERPLDPYLGSCRVVRATVGRGERVTGDDLRDLPDPPDVERVLINTGTFPDPTHWNEDFAGLDPALVDHLAHRGMKLIGIDTPSVDLFDDKTLMSHSRFLAHDMAILEGIVLRDVPDGLYELIALPLPLVGFDASPVRAVLRSK